MKKTKDKTVNQPERKKMYCINIMDGTELWLGHDKEPIAAYYYNDANFRKEYQGFIFRYLDIKLVCDAFYPDNEDLRVKLEDAGCDVKILAKLLNKEIDKL